MPDRDDSAAWLPFEEFLASGAAASGRPAQPGRDAPPVRGPGGQPGPVPGVARPGPASEARPDPQRAAGPRILLVGDLTRVIRDVLRDSPRLRDVWVEGEVGQVTVSSAGHCYFTLKDERAQLRCMIFRDDRLSIPFEPRTGLRLVAHGRLDLFEPQGVYQLYVDAIQPAGFGDLALRFEATKARLAAEGLFEPGRKRPLPAWPRTIGVVTSLSGAVLHDIRQVLARRWPMVRVVVSSCQVQGAGAPESIVAALRRVGRWTDPTTGRGTDLVIVARGGGSLEDLWAFNEEAVVRAIAAHPCPVVVGVGHETDVTLAEFAADVRAATPSVAAELSVPARADQAARLATLDARLTTAGRRAVDGPRARLDAERRALDGFRPAAYLAAERERVGLLLDRATRAVDARLDAEEARLSRLHERLPLLLQGRLARARTDLRAGAAGLAALSPYATLERGYAIVRTPDGRVVRTATDAAPGDALAVTLHEGALDVRVEAVRDSGP
ncbi:MAG: exodeoxyribonuclease VII large subunit [Chloroflexota bacterium]